MSKPALLLISSSTVHPSAYLEHASPFIKSFLGKRLKSSAKILFFPYALKDYDGYGNRAKDAFYRMGYDLESIHTFSKPVQAILEADAIFIGGGNTFRLLKKLYDLQLIDAIRKRVLNDGIPYIGTSAGSNVACLSIKTTNDMPIVYPPSFQALELAPFQINPHYLDADPSSTHKGETREQRIKEFHEENETPVIGLREGSMLEIEGESCKLLGTTNARIFFRNEEPKEFKPNDDLSFLLR